MILHLILTFLFSANLIAHVDLETNIQDFVLETKRIEIPGHPYAFNASIIRWEDSILMSFREILSDNPESNSINSAGCSQIGVVWLDNEFNPISEAQMLTFHAGLETLRSEDPRLIQVGDDLYLIFSDNRDEFVTEGGFRVYVAQLHYQDGIFNVTHVEKLSDYEDANLNRREKNWVPFDYEGHLLLAYTLVPHKIYYPYLDDTERCETICISNRNLPWKWGEIRGGTPAINIDNTQYLSFFHSSQEIPTIHSDNKTVLHYFIGAYTFSLIPPFEITQISPEPIIGPNFYHGPIYTPYWKPVRVVFPCGLLNDEEAIYVSYGRQDHEIWIVKLDKVGLLKSLKKVK